jgi:hypothetical protein
VYFGSIFVLSIILIFVISDPSADAIVVLAIKTLYFIAILVGVLSLFYSFLAYKNKEQGLLKWLAPIIISFVVIGFITIVYWAFLL